MPNFASPPTLQWPYDTFCVRPKLDLESLRGEWWPFWDNTVDVVEQVRAYCDKLLPMMGYGGVYSPPRAKQDAWPEGEYWISHSSGYGVLLMMGFDAEHDTHNLLGMYPFSSQGTQHSVVLQEVMLMLPGEIEAYLTVTLGGRKLSFWDNAYMLNRLWYQAGQRYDFLLLGIACYLTEPPEPVISVYELVPPPDTKKVTQPAKRTSKTKLKPPLLRCLHTANGYDELDYQFCGHVTQIKAFDDFLGQAGWCARLAVLPQQGDDVNSAQLDVLITARLWGRSEAPHLGQLLAGTLWLQGHLWQAH